MKRLILVGFLTAAALALQLPAAASATVLCKANGASCSADHVLESGESFFMSETKGLTFPGTNVACFVLTQIKVTDSGDEGEPAEADVTTFDLSCKNSGAFCLAEAFGLPYSAEFEGTGGSGSMVVSPLTAVVACPGAICQIVVGEAKLELFGGSTAGAVGSVAVTNPGECGASSGSFLLLTPSLYLVGGPHPGAVTRLCTQNLNPCPVSSRISTGSTLEATLEGNSQFEFLYEGKKREPACEGGTLTGKTTAAGKPLLGEISALSFSKCGGGVCAVEAQSLPYKAEVEKTTGGSGTATLGSGGSGSPKIEVNCGAAFKCVYKASSVSMALTGGNPAKLAVSATLEKDAASQAECGSTMTWTATYKLTKPAPLFVTS